MFDAKALPLRHRALVFKKTLEDHPEWDAFVNFDALNAAVGNGSFAWDRTPKGDNVLMDRDGAVVFMADLMVRLRREAAVAADADIARRVSSATFREGLYEVAPSFSQEDAAKLRGQYIARYRARFADALSNLWKD